MLFLIPCLCRAVALTPPELLVRSNNAVLLTAPPRSVDKDGALASRLAKLTNASAFVVDPTLHEPAPLRLPTIELFVADDTTRREIDSRRAALEAAAGNAWARSNARAHRVASLNDDILVERIFAEYQDTLFPDMPPVHVSDGTIAVPTGVGLGYEVGMAAVERCELSSPSSKL